jgi:hypothetical protein
VFVLCAPEGVKLSSASCWSPKESLSRSSCWSPKEQSEAVPRIQTQPFAHQLKIEKIGLPSKDTTTPMPIQRKCNGQGFFERSRTSYRRQFWDQKNEFLVTSRVKSSFPFFLSYLGNPSYSKPNQERADPYKFLFPNFFNSPVWS